MEIRATVSSRSMRASRISISRRSPTRAARPKGTSMFRKIAAFEARYQLTSPVFWVAFALFFLMTFAATTIPQIQIGSRGNTNVNAPVAMVQVFGIMSIFAIFILTAFVANVVVRDDETGYGPIVRSTPIRKFDYLFGRFGGAFVAGAIAFLSVPLGVLLGSFMP